MYFTFKMNTLFSKYQFDIMSTYFSLTYFYENEMSIRSFFQNVNDNLKIGGYLIGTCFDGQKVIELFGKKKELEGKKNGKVIWKIEKLYRNGKFDYSKPLYGKKINVFVSSIGKSFQEHLVNFEYFKTLFSMFVFFCFDLFTIICKFIILFFGFCAGSYFVAPILSNILCFPKK